MASPHFKNMHSESISFAFPCETSFWFFWIICLAKRLALLCGFSGMRSPFNEILWIPRTYLLNKHQFDISFRTRLWFARNLYEIMGSCIIWMNEYRICLCYINKKQEYTINTRKYMILLERKACLIKGLVALRAKWSTSQKGNICEHDQNKKAIMKVDFISQY